MAKQAFREKRFRNSIRIRLSTGQYWAASTWDLIDRILSTVELYQEKGIKMTLRQLYYQLVAGDLIPNDIKVYSKLSTFVTDLRYNGLIDWDAIEDRGRRPIEPPEFSNLDDLVEAALYTYRLPRWSDQEKHVELFTEKDALSSILEPIANEYHINFCVNRGYASATAMYNLFERALRNIRKGKKVVILYLGDHDPSGLDMIRDIEERLNEFIAAPWDCIYFKVEQVALSMNQIKKYSPPPNPAKIQDPRAKGYIQRFGRKSWEVDALPPDIMIQTVKKAIEKHFQKPLYQEWIKREDIQKEELKRLVNRID